MALSNVTGVLSRYFVVGFFVPVFAATVVYSQIVSSELLPDVYEKQSAGTQIAIVGATALLLGLVLLGLNYPITRAFEGYPLKTAASWLAGRTGRTAHVFAVGANFLLDARIAAHVRRRAQLRAQRDDSSDAGARSTAAWRLDSRYPRLRRDLLPTSFGNVVRAFELHSSRRWGLDAIAAQPRIAALASMQEHEIEADARSEAAFFVNLSLLSFLTFICCMVDLIAFRSGSVQEIVAPVLPLIFVWMFYRASIGAAVRWGSTVRAAIDLHRLELYTKLGVVQPATFEQERTVIGPAVSRCLLHGNRLPNELRAPPTATGEEHT